MKLEDVIVGMKVIPHSKSTGCSFNEFNNATSVHRKIDPWLYVCCVQNDGVIELSTEMDDLYDHRSYFLPEDFEQWCNAEDAPEGYYAIVEQSCSECDFYHDDCNNMNCCATDRKDGCTVIYKKKQPVIVETVLDNTEGTISTTDPVDHPSHYTSGEIECIDAIKASMSKEAFCGFLKGNQIKYLWRYEKKINPLEDIKKAGWYRDRLEKELQDAL